MWPEERVADSRGGGEIRSGDGGSEKQINCWCCQFALGKQRWPWGWGEERKMEQLKLYGLLGHAGASHLVGWEPKSDCTGLENRWEND